MRTRYGWCWNPQHGPYAHFHQSTCTDFTVWASQAPPLPERNRA